MGPPGFQIKIDGSHVFTLCDDGRLVVGPGFKSVDEMSRLFLDTLSVMFPQWQASSFLSKLQSYRTGPTSRACLRGLLRVSDALADQIVDTVLTQVAIEIREQIVAQAALEAERQRIAAEERQRQVESELLEREVLENFAEGHT